MVIIVSHVQTHFSHLPTAACRGRSDQSKVDKDAGQNAAPSSFIVWRQPDIRSNQYASI